VIIAVIEVRVMQVSVDQVVGVVTMLNRFVTTAIAMHMIGFVCTAAMVGGALLRIPAVYGEPMLVHMVAVRVVEVAVVQVIGVPLVNNRGMAAVRPVLM